MTAMMTPEERADLLRRIGATRRAQLALEDRLRAMERLRAFLVEGPGSTATHGAARRCFPR